VRSLLRWDGGEVGGGSGKGGWQAAWKETDGMI